jgi:hypothetical protein
MMAECAKEKPMNAWQDRIVWAVLACGIALAPGAAASAGGIDACATTTEQAYRSCVAGVESDRHLALGKCANIPDPAAAGACQQQAASDASDGAHECADQRGARKNACDRLGPAPYSPVIDPANFVAKIDNPYFPLTPGTTFVYESPEEHDEVFVTHKTRVIDGVTCTEVLDTVSVGDKVTERTLDWYAQDKDGNVWYFGENSEVLMDGLVVDLGGSFAAGVDGAQPGIIMQAHPALGDFYRQEFLLDEAEDLAEVIKLSETVKVPFGRFTNCLRTRETESLDPAALENKLYAPGVGNILTVDRVTGERLPLLNVLTE